MNIRSRRNPALGAGSDRAAHEVEGFGVTACHGNPREHAEKFCGAGGYRTHDQGIEVS
jgi:hypothetical protein